ncbi:MAG: serine/threonine-protein kinase [Polyangiaceae bacterium]
MEASWIILPAPGGSVARKCDVRARDRRNFENRQPLSHSRGQGAASDRLALDDQPFSLSDAERFARRGQRSLRRDALQNHQAALCRRYGEIFLVKHAALGRMLAAKVLHARLAQSANLIDRARVEAQTLARLRHANIVEVTGFGYTNDGRPYIVMEYLRGRTLDEELKAVGALTIADALDFTSQLLSALVAAHELGVVHRDIKPSNLVLCEPHDGRRTLKVLDFGVARVLPGASPQAPDPPAVATDSGIIVGTPRYLSPEGAQGQRVDTRADIYAAALMLYVMLTGRGPFDEIARDTAVLLAHVARVPPAPSLFAQQVIPRELDIIVLKALEKDPERRYQSALEFKQELDHLAAVLACPPALQATTVLGDLTAAGPSHDAKPPQKSGRITIPTTTQLDAHSAETRAPVAAPSTPSSSLVWRAIAVFVVFGLLMAAVVAWMELG